MIPMVYILCSLCVWLSLILPASADAIAEPLAPFRGSPSVAAVLILALIVLVVWLIHRKK